MHSSELSLVAGLELLVMLIMLPVQFIDQFIVLLLLLLLIEAHATATVPIAQCHRDDTVSY
jgi:hypothetical protein